MAINTWNDFIGSSKSFINYSKFNTSATGLAATWFSTYYNQGYPGSGSLAVSNLTNGQVPSSSMPGFPNINYKPVSGSNAYLGSVIFSNQVSGRFMVADVLFKAGEFSFNSSASLTSQPSYLGRIPTSSLAGCYGTEIWLEAVTAFTGLQSIKITYTNEGDIGGRNSGTVATGVAPKIGQMYKVPLQEGDNGVKKIDNVLSSVATIGTFNVLVLRPLFLGHINWSTGGTEVYGIDRVCMPEVFSGSALSVFIASDTANLGLFDAQLTIVSK